MNLQMIKFVFSADWHINNTIIGKQKGGIPIRVLDCLQNIDSSIDFAIENEADFYLFGGDMYRNSKPSSHYKTMVHERVMRLVRNGVKVIIIPGNHDMSKSDIKEHALSEFRSLDIDGVYLIEEKEVITFDGIEIVGIPWQYEPFEWDLQLDPDLFSICIAHCTIPTAIFQSGLEAGGELVMGTDFYIDEEFFEQFDMSLLGHLHVGQILNHNPLIAYSGASEWLTWGELSCQPGFIYGIVYKENDYSWQKIPYKNRPRHDLQIFVDSMEHELPEVDPEAMYRIKLISSDPTVYLPSNDVERHFKNAFACHVKEIRPRPNRADKYPNLENQNPTDQLEVWFETIDMEFDEELRELWTEISTNI